MGCYRSGSRRPKWASGSGRGATGDQMPILIKVSGQLLFQFRGYRLQGLDLWGASHPTRGSNRFFLEWSELIAGKLSVRTTSAVFLPEEDSFSYQPTSCCNFHGRKSQSR